MGHGRGKGGLKLVQNDGRRPQRSFLAASVCDDSNTKQHWSLLADGTLRASNNLTEQCLTAEALSVPANAHVLEVYAGALADGGAAVLFFNSGPSPAEGTLPLSELKLGSRASVKNIWGAEAAKVEGGVLHSGQVASHDVAFMRLIRDRRTIVA